ncbi:MAG: hypothetical protein MUF23_07350, partial [Pirellula sp.]|nr:hypothetical protein [Pirellula sp.]
MNARYSLRSIFFFLIATAMLLSLFIIVPSLTGFDIESSRRFLFAGLLGGAFAGACSALVREHFLSARFALRVLIAVLFGTSLSYGILVLHCKQYERVGSWPGMAAIFLLPATAFVSALCASIVCLSVPKAWVSALESTFFQPAPRIPHSMEPITDETRPARSPTISFGVAWIVIALGSLIPCLFLDSWYRVFAFVIPVFGPIMLASAPMWLCRTASAQRVFLVATIAYAMWLLYLFVLTPARSLSDPYYSVGVAAVIYVVAI